MTTAEPEIGAAADLETLGKQLVRAAKGSRYRAAAQALASERTVLAVPQVRRALVVERDWRPTCEWEGLMGKLYTLPLDEAQRRFLGLVLSMVGIGHVSLSAVADLDEERVRIITQAILTAAGSDSIAIGTRL
ncbi:hypothetical protein [Streptomyces adustus]|uniref:hypothetical protein n=1 Tax=Streptomyces adustus TaxID=1609272 RepID=UPI0037131C1B